MKKLIFLIAVSLICVGFCISVSADEQVSQPFEDVVQGEDGGWYYTAGGVIQWDYTGLKSNSYGTWRIENGRVNFDCNSLIYNFDDEQWYLVNDGAVSYGTTKIVSNGNGDWMVVDGRVDFSANGIFYLEFNGEMAWWYVQGGKVDYTTYVANNEYGWFFCENGKVNFSANTVAWNENGWWKITNGCVDFGYTGLASNAYGWWMLVNGRVDFDYYGLVQNENGWWYVEDGQVKFSYYGAVSNAFGTWLVEGSQVQFINGKRTLWINGQLEDRFISNGLVLDGGVETYVLSRSEEKLNQVGWDLYAAYSYSISLIKETASQGSSTSEYALYSFDTGYGDCLGCASAFCWMARRMGYQCNVLYGYVPNTSGGRNDHAWCEIIINGEYYWVDPSFGRTWGNGYMIHYGDPGTWVYEDWHLLQDF